MRCRYCMPEAEYVWLPRESILTFEEMDRLAGVFAGLGVRQGPTDRRRAAPAARPAHAGRRCSAATEPIEDIALTTNGILLARHAAALRSAGLRRVTISLDTLRPERMVAFARSARHAEVLEGIAAAAEAGFDSIKLNTVVIRGHNDDEVTDLLEFARGRGLEIRFIEYMDVGGATRWTMDASSLAAARSSRPSRRRYGAVDRDPQGRRGRPPSAFALTDGTTFGVIASTTAPFCRTCDRARLTADGTFLLCLYGERGLDLRELLRGGASDDEIGARIAETWAARTDRGAEERAALRRSRRAPSDRQPSRRSPARDAHPRRLMALHVALIQPQIPPNTGNIARLCAATDTPLHLIGPLGFSLDAREVKRAGLDYWDKVDLWVHPDWFAFRDAMSREPLPLLLGQRRATTTGERRSGIAAVLVFGSETEGMPHADPREASPPLLPHSHAR